MAAPTSRGAWPRAASARRRPERVRISLQQTIDALAAATPAPDPIARASAAIRPATADAPWTLVVGHDGIFKVAVLALLGLPLDRFWAFPWGLTGISVVELVAGRAVLRAHNLTDHLGPLQADQTASATGAAEARSEAEAASRERTGSL